MSAPLLSYFSNPLFEAVQRERIFKDSKTFVDCIPSGSMEELNQLYLTEKEKPGFDLSAFVHLHFTVPVPHSAQYAHNKQLSVTENIETLWNILSRTPETAAGSLIALPFPYVVPGGRFGEIYYWDSYFTMLGLRVSGKITMIENMVRNFAWLIDQFGYIPNGNRTYFTGRSQPPFFALMVKLLAEEKGENILATYLPQLLREHAFWMNRNSELTESMPAGLHLVRMPDGELLNRYWDDADLPRPESWKEDVELMEKHPRPGLYRHIRAGAESGWDYSSRWFSDKQHLHSIHTCDIIPVDLNSLLYIQEKTIWEACRLSGDAQRCSIYQRLAEERIAAIRKYCWNETAGFYMDYDFTTQKHTGIFSLAGLYPSFAGFASKEETNRMAITLEKDFLKEGGLISTLHTTGEQWDAPNGWAPLHWISIQALEQYNHQDLATDIAKRWINMNIAVFKRSGKFMEKYNVTDTRLDAGGGEYEGQDGFGWTNGVLLALLSKYGHNE